MFSAETAKKSRKAPWLVFGSIGALVVLLIIVVSVNLASSGSNPSGGPADKPAAEASTEPVDEESAAPVEEPEPAAPELGTLDNPFPLGYSLSIYQGSPDNTLASMTVAVKDWNANAAIAQANQFNDPAQPGFHYVAVEYTITGANTTEPASASQLLYDWTLSQADGVMIAETNSSLSYPDGWNQTYDLPDLYEGQTGAVVVVYQVPDAYTGALFATAYGQYVALQ